MSQTLCAVMSCFGQNRQYNSGSIHEPIGVHLHGDTAQIGSLPDNSEECAHAFIMCCAHPWHGELVDLLSMRNSLYQGGRLNLKVVQQVWEKFSQASVDTIIHSDIFFFFYEKQEPLGVEALHPWPRHVVLHIPTSQPDNINSNRMRDQQRVLIVIIWLQFQCFKMVLEMYQFGNFFWLQVLCRNMLIACVLQSSSISNIRLENR